MSEDSTPDASPTKLSSSLSIENAGNVEFDDIISDNAQYGRIQFWDLRYAEEHEPFEWYYPYDYFRDTIREHIPLEKKIMIAGCGSSNMIGDMADDGYQNLVGADFSRVVLTQLKYRYRNYSQISFFQGNMTDTDLPEQSFDAIIDKALIDSLLCTQNTAVTVQQYIFEVERLLTDDGIFICISHGNPELILPHIDQFDIEEPTFTPWAIEVQAVLKPKEFPTEELDPSDPDSMYFVYICKKVKDLVIRKKIKQGRLTKKQFKKMRPKPKRVNIKPANSETNL